MLCKHGSTISSASPMQIPHSGISDPFIKIDGLPTSMSSEYLRRRMKYVLKSDTERTDFIGCLSPGAEWRICSATIKIYPGISSKHETTYGNIRNSLLTFTYTRFVACRSAKCTRFQEIWCQVILIYARQVSMLIINSRSPNNRKELHLNCVLHIPHDRICRHCPID